MNINIDNVADYGRDNHPTSIVVHHTAGNLNATHADVLVNFQSWTRRGYHYIIRGSGEIHQSVQEHSMSWGAKNQNINRIHISLTGHFEKEYPTQAQINSAGKLIADIRRRRNIPNSHVFTHHQVPQQATLCAGRNLDLNDLIIDSSLSTTPSANPNNTNIHIVQSNETLLEIAHKHHTTVAELVRLNYIENVNVILVGQILTLPFTTERATLLHHQIQIGSQVRVNLSAQRWITGENIHASVHGQIYDVQQIGRAGNNDHILIGHNRKATGWIHRKDVTVV